MGVALARPRMRVVYPLFLVASLFGCDLDEPGEEPGVLGNGDFYYDCTSVNDPSCPNPPVSGQLPFPSAVAFGGTFGLTYSSTTQTPYPNVAVQPVSSDFFSTTGSDFTAIRLGAPWFVAIAEDGSILDMASLNVVPIASVAVAELTPSYLACWGPCPQPAPDVRGTTHRFVAAAQDAHGRPLAGDVLYSWATSDPNVAAIVSDQPFPSDSVDVFYAGSGSATLYAWTSTAQGSTTATVLNAPDVASTAGDGGDEP
jgi:hypothetical protein